MSIPRQEINAVNPFLFSRVPAFRSANDAIKQDLALVNDCFPTREQAILAVEMA